MQPKCNPCKQSLNLATAPMPAAIKMSVGPAQIPKSRAQVASKLSKDNVYSCTVMAKPLTNLRSLTCYRVISLIKVTESADSTCSSTVTWNSDQ